MGLLSSSSKSKSTSTSVDNRTNYDSGDKVFDTPNYWPFAVVAVVFLIVVLEMRKKQK